MNCNHFVLLTNQQLQVDHNILIFMLFYKGEVPQVTKKTIYVKCLLITFFLFEITTTCISQDH